MESVIQPTELCFRCMAVQLVLNRSIPDGYLVICSKCGATLGIELKDTEPCEVPEVAR